MQWASSTLVSTPPRPAVLVWNTHQYAVDVVALHVGGGRLQQPPLPALIVGDVGLHLAVVSPVSDQHACDAGHLPYTHLHLHLGAFIYIYILHFIQSDLQRVFALARSIRFQPIFSEESWTTMYRCRYSRFWIEQVSTADNCGHKSYIHS